MFLFFGLCLGWPGGVLPGAAGGLGLGLGVILGTFPLRGMWLVAPASILLSVLGLPFRGGRHNMTDASGEAERGAVQSMASHFVLPSAG